MTGMEIIEVVIAIWFTAFLALVAIAIKNLTNALDYHTRAIHRLITVWENIDDDDR